MLIISKNNKSIVNESVTRSNDIYNYGKTWTTEYEPRQFTNILQSFIDGVQAGLKENMHAYKNDEFASEIIEELINYVGEISEIIDEMPG